MLNSVTISLETYDELRDTIYKLENNIKIIKEQHNKELKEIFKLSHNYSSLGLEIDYGKVIKRLYGEIIEISNETFVLTEKSELTNFVYNVWEFKEED